jgi:hypothetical protein
MRPSPDTTPAQFFQSWLPTHIGVLGPVDPPLTVRVFLEGAGGGTWDLKRQTDTLEIAPAGDREPEVSVEQSVDDWRAFIIGEPGEINLAPAQTSAAGFYFLDPAVRRLVSLMKGTARLEVTGYRGRTWAMTVTFGTPWRAAPNATVRVDAASFAAVLRRELTPDDLLSTGKFQAIGDIHLSMQLAMALLP